MDEIIQLRNRDITKELFDRAQFISWAEGGAMGDAGGVMIVTDDGKSYYCNWAYGDADPKLIIKACTILKKFPDLPAEWEYHYLGMGNHLVYLKKYDEEYRRLLGENNEPELPYEVYEYQNWYSAAMKIFEAHGH